MDAGDHEMYPVTLELTDETVETLDDIAFANHQGNRATAVRELLDQWLKSRGE